MSSNNQLVRKRGYRLTVEQLRIKNTLTLRLVLLLTKSLSVERGNHIIHRSLIMSEKCISEPLTGQYNL